MEVIVLAGFIMFVIQMLVASKFETIARMKGHSGYFGWCVWLGLIGWAMVIALPDRNQPAPKRTDDTNSTVHKQPPEL